jgi:hypothetical protein
MLNSVILLSEMGEIPGKGVTDHLGLVWLSSLLLPPEDREAPPAIL